MPTTENDRRNLAQPVLERPSLPDHDRSKDEGMHAAQPDETRESRDERGALDEREIAAPDQEFGEMLESGTRANQGQIPEDPNNWLTSDLDPLDDDPESRGESLPDILDGDKH